MQNELLKLTKHIGLIAFENHSNEVYESKNINMKEFEYLLIKTKLEKYVREIAELCLFASQNKDIGLPREKKYWQDREQSYKYIQTELEKCQVLKMLFENQNYTEITFHNKPEKIKLSLCKDELTHLVISYLDNDLFGSYDRKLNVDNKIEILNNKISRYQKFRPRRGAPPKNQYIGTLAEIILCIINFPEYSEYEKEYQKLTGKYLYNRYVPNLVEINETNISEVLDTIDELDKLGIEKQKEARKNALENDENNLTSNLEISKFMELENIDDPRKMVEIKYADCVLIHDILCFWGLIDDVRKKEIFKDTPYDYIRNMLRNLRKQRPNIHIQGSGKEQELDTYLI